MMILCQQYAKTKNNIMRIKKITEATAYIMQMVLFIMSLPFAWWWFYRSNSDINHRFCFNMCSHDIFRMLYAFIFASGICTVNTLHVIWTHDHQSTLMTLAVSFLFLGDAVRHRLLTAINRSRHILFGLMLISLAAAFTDNMLPFAISLYLLIVASVFYPSRPCH